MPACSPGFATQLPAVLLHCAELEFSIEDLESGRFAHVAWVHGGLLDFRAASDDRDDLYNRVGDPFVAIHLWSAESDVGKQVVLPFVAEFEPRLLNGDLTKTLQPNSLQSLGEVAAQSQQANLDATVAGVDSELAMSEVSRTEASNAAAGSQLGIASGRNTAAGRGQSAAVSSDTPADRPYVAAADSDVLVNPSVAAAGRGTASDAGQVTAARSTGQARANRARRRRQSEPRQDVQ